jgi:hypothetical protein
MNSERRNMKMFLLFPEFHTATRNGACTGIRMTFLLLVISVMDGFGQCNLISNPGFESGNTGFTSAFTYNPTSLVSEYTYTVGYNATTYHPSFSGVANSGNNMMIANGTTVNYSNAIIYQTSATVVQNTTYTFSMWCREVFDSSDPVFQVYINDVLIGSATVGFGWLQYVYSWTSGANITTATIKIKEYSYNSNNDYALDDLSLSACTQPAAPTAISGITAICPGGRTTLSAAGGMSAYYPFAGDVNDYSGNGLHLSGSGGTFPGGGGIQLSNTSAYISPVTSVLNTDKYTISFDMKYTSASDGSWRKIFGYEPAGTDRSPGIWRYPSTMQLHWGHGGATTVSDAFTYALDQWYHVVGVKDGSTFTLFIDGVLQTQGTVINPKIAGCAGLWFGGANVALKEFKVYSGIVRWYTGNCSGTSIGSGPSINVTPAATTSYYVRLEGNCNNSACASATVTVTNPPAPQAIGNITVGPVCNAQGAPLLPDASITASTYLGGHETWRGRLFYSGTAPQAWACGSPFTGSWWQVDLGSVKPVNGVATQIRGDYPYTNQRVMTYNVQYSTDNTNWYSVAGGPFTGNSTGGDYTVVTNMFPVAYQARYVRILPLSWQEYCSMRADVISIPSIRCGTSNVSASAELVACATGIRWYDASSGGTLLGSGQYITRTISSNTTIYAEAFNGSAVSSRTPVTLKVNPLPGPVIYADGPTTFCEGGSVNLAVREGTALSLNGSTQFASTPNLTSFFLTTSMTVELWFNTTFPGVILDERGQADGAGGWQDSQVEILSTGEVKARVWNLTPVSLGTVSFGTWHHTVVRYDATTTKLDGFLDGVVSGSFTIGTRSAPQGSGYNQYWTIGEGDVQHLGSGAYFNGQIDEVRIWNVARTNTQITSSWNKSVPNNSANLVAYYKMDEGSGTSLADASGKGNAGILFNTPAWVNQSTAPVNYYATYSWSPGGFTTPSISATLNANYTVTLTDANGCTVNAAKQVTVYPTPQGSLTANGTFCVSGAGQLTWIANAGTGPFTVVYNDGAANRTKTGIVSGTAFDVYTTPVTSTTTYTLISVTDYNGCVRSSGFTGGSATIRVNALPSFSVTHTDVSCFGGNDGSINVHINSAANSPYTFSIDNGANYNATFTGTYPNFILTGLSATTYKIRVKDNIGCESPACQ